MKSLRRYQLSEFIASRPREGLFIKIHWDSSVGWVYFEYTDEWFKHFISNAHFVKMVRDSFFRRCGYAAAASKSVIAALEKAGGSFEKVAAPLQKSAKEAEAEDEAK